ncbi:MAG: hypothetical protein HOU81_00270 [Hamadaea sp.]|uniref:hypothetical protein n=1 Tax=Hamadaea sp. TaxID=2024425 RepID=UPI001809E873|nr:hypothetical protein [Hamadaea sp.]NUR69252.1 hypothetical protein [Hamadaea sp.]NUT21114.1 hypothetical protein [Hamadaea sp.]
MPEVRRLTIRLSGGLDQSTLERLRADLGLRRRGRLTDVEDWEFGYRALDGSTAMLRLWRFEDTRWAITLDSAYADTPGDSEVAELAELAEQSARRAGFTIVDRIIGAPA